MQNGHRLLVEFDSKQHTQRKDEQNPPPLRSRFTHAVGVRLELLVDLVSGTLGVSFVSSNVAIPLIQAGKL